MVSKKHGKHKRRKRNRPKRREMRQRDYQSPPPKRGKITGWCGTFRGGLQLKISFGPEIGYDPERPDPPLQILDEIAKARKDGD
jgi:hypothetical protein